MSATSCQVSARGSFVNKVKIRKEKFAVRCEICHQSDCFNPQTQYCSRCSGLRIPEETEFLKPTPQIENWQAVNIDEQFFGKINNVCIKVGLILGTVSAIIPCVKLMLQDGFFSVYVLTIFLGTAFGAIMGLIIGTVVTFVVSIIKFFLKIWH